jgi:hypothetical protein
MSSYQIKKRNNDIEIEMPNQETRRENVKQALDRYYHDSENFLWKYRWWIVLILLILLVVYIYSKRSGSSGSTGSTSTSGQAGPQLQQGELAIGSPETVKALFNL